MPMLVRASLLALLLALLGACAPTQAEVALVATATPTPPTLTPSPAAASPTRTESTPTPSAAPTLAELPTPSATPTPTLGLSTTADLLLSAQARDFCDPAAPDRGCGKPLTLLIADYLQRHPADQQAVALWRRIIELGAPTAALGADDPQRIDVTWAFDDWAQAEFLALNLPTALTNPLTSSMSFGTLTIIPTNLDGDATQDYLLSATISGFPDEIGQIRWMRWRDGAWAGEHLLTYANDGGQIQVGDVTGDTQPELLVRSGMCGASKCFGWQMGWTWRDGALTSLFPFGTTTSQVWAHQDKGRLTVASQYADYTFDGQFLTPADLAVPTGRYSDRIETQMTYAHGLAVLGRFDEAITVLDAVAALSDKNSTFESSFGSSFTQVDGRPVALFRIGAIHLLNHDPAAARAAWDRVAQTYPQSLAAKVVQDLNLTSFDGSLSQWCETLAAHQVVITDDHRRDYLDNFSTNEFDWLPLCHPRLRLPLHSWTQAAPLADQVAALGMPWQPLSDEYDLNGDGVSDPLGVVDWLGIYTPWAFLSTADGYQPLYVMQPWEIGTPLATLTDPSYSFERPTTATITDLDADGAPEWLFDNPYRFNLAAWHGDRFQPNSVSFYQNSSSFSATLTLAPQPDGTQRIVADLLPADDRQPNPSRIEYALRDGTLQQSAPAFVDLSGEYSFGKEYVSTTMICVALFGRNDPARALELLTVITPAPSGVWHEHERQVLQALALEYSGQPAEAQRLLAEVASATPPTGWSRFARERR